MKGYLLVLTVILAFMFVLAGCSGSTGAVANNGQNPVQPATMNKQGVAPTNQGSGNQQAQASAPKNIENGQIGTAYEISYMGTKYQVTLSRTAFATSSYGGTRYLLAYFEIKNTGEISEYFMPDVYAISADTEKYDKTIVAMGIGSEYDKTLDYAKKLTPGTKMSGWVPIEVPENESQFDLYFEYTNPFLDNKPQYIKYKVTN